MPDLIRWRYYMREAQVSVDIAARAKARGDKAGARTWLEQASSELDMAAFWRSNEAPNMPYLKPGFML